MPACERAHGQETAGAQDASPDASPNRFLEFAALYRTNCSGCHGPDGGGGAALALADPIYLTIANDAIVRRAIANGVRGTAMPSFSRESGGTLTDAQIDAIVWGIRHWANHPASISPTSPALPALPASPTPIDAPPYADDEPGDAQRGAVVFETWCSRCHGAGGAGGPKASSIVDPAYLALVSDQGLRTTVIAGRRELGAPDWRGNLPGRAMTSREIADVVAWLAAQRSRSNDSASESHSASGSQP